MRVGGLKRTPLRGLIMPRHMMGNVPPEYVSSDAHQDSKLTFMTVQDDRDKDTTTMLHMKPISSSIPLPQDRYTTHFNAACSYSDTSCMKAAYPPTTKNVDYVSASLPHVNITTLLDDNAHVLEMLVAQLDLTQQQAAMDKKQIREELFGLKNRIKS